MASPSASYGRRHGHARGVLCCSEARTRGVLYSDAFELRWPSAARTARAHRVALVGPGVARGVTTRESVRGVVGAGEPDLAGASPLARQPDTARGSTHGVTGVRTSARDQPPSVCRHLTHRAFGSVRWPVGGCDAVLRARGGGLAGPCACRRIGRLLGTASDQGWRVRGVDLPPLCTRASCARATPDEL